MRSSEFSINKKRTIKLNEVNMSPGALKSFISTSIAQNMTIGFEAEMLVPGLIDPGKNTTTPDLSMDMAFPITDDWMDIAFNWLSNGNNSETARWNKYCLSRFQDDYNVYVDNKISDYLETPKGEQDLRHRVAAQHVIDDDDLITTDITTKNHYYKIAYNKIKAVLSKTQRLFVKFLKKARIKTFNDFCNIQGLRYPYVIITEHGTLKCELLVKRFRRATGFKVTNGDDYHTVNREPDLWIFEPDGSIDDPTGKSGGIELVSPPMLLPKAFDALDKFWSWAIKSKIKTNDTCGFHVGVSLPDHNNQSIDYLKLMMFLGEDYILKAFGRENNEYTESIVKKIRTKLSYLWKNEKDQSIEALKTNIKNLAKVSFLQELTKVSDRHVTVNLQNNNYIEFRAAGGNYLDNKEKIMTTIMRYVKAVSMAASDENSDEYAKKLYKLLSNNNSPKKDAIFFFSKYVAGEIDADALKYFIHQVRDIRKYPPRPDLRGLPVVRDD
jgi:hypothetical protein